MTRFTIPLLLSATLAGAALAALPATHVHAQIRARAYAPERLWELSSTEQRRVISHEYSEQSGGRRIPEDQMRFYLDQVRLSRWTFSRVKADIAESLGYNNGGNYPPGQGSGNTIRCESRDKRQQTCRTPWRGRSELVRQLSGTPCTEGQSWSSSNGQVWVRNGCRAEFRKARWDNGGGIGNGQEIRCESADGRYRQCGSNLYGTPRLVRQLSDTACREGQNWGLRNGYLWVDNGCRGIFRVDRNGGGPGSGYSVTCTSENNRYTTCAWDRNRGVPRLIQQLSDSPCVEGSSWGYDWRNGLWVNRGCRARFGAR